MKQDEVLNLDALSEGQFEQFVDSLSDEQYDQLVDAGVFERPSEASPELMAGEWKSAHCLDCGVDLGSKVEAREHRKMGHSVIDVIGAKDNPDPVN